MLHQDTRSLDSGPARLARLVRTGETHVGRGVFARRRIASGIVLAEVHGTILEDHPEDSSYVMELPGGRLLDPAAPLRFVNHSCDPNCELFYWEAEPGDLEEERLWLQTICPIEPGAELKAAAQEAEIRGLRMALIDRDAGITLKRSCAVRQYWAI